MSLKVPKLRRGWRILFGYLLEYKRDVVLLSVLGVISALANGIVPYVTGHFLDSVLGTRMLSLRHLGSVPVWAAYLGGWVLLQLVSNIVDWLIDQRRRFLGTAISTFYTSSAVAQLLLLPISFYKENKSGDIWDRIRRAENAITSVLEQVIINLAPQILSVFVGIVVAYAIHPIYAFILGGGISLYLLTLWKIASPMGVIMEQAQKTWGEAYGRAHDAVGNYQTVKQAGAEEYEGNIIMRKFREESYRAWNKVEEIWSRIGFFQRIIVAGTQLTIFIFSVAFVRAGTISLGDLIALNAYAGMAFGPFVNLGFNWQYIQNAAISLERANEMLATVPEPYVPEKQGGAAKISGAVAFDHVTFAYEDEQEPVLKDINFSIEPGQTVALVGESGGGKTTTVDLISGYYFPQEGEVQIDSMPIRELGVAAVRKAIAVVPQEPVLFNDTIKANIAYAKPDATDEEIREAARRAHADEFIEHFSEKYEQLVGERGVKLSVGQKQRVAIARAILRDPTILILDEPTSALDAKTERFINESLHQLMRGRTTFIIAHRLSTVREADRILVYDKGHVVEEGRHEDLIQKEDGVYRRLYEYQIGLHA